MTAAVAVPRPPAPAAPAPTADREPAAGPRADRRARLLDRARHPIEVPEPPALGEDDVRAVFGPVGPWEDWLARMVAVTATRAGDCPRAEQAMRLRAMFRAAHCWEEDRKRAAEDRAAGLARNPARVVARLCATPAGIDWLVGRWRDLARVDSVDWSDEHRTLCVRLLGGNETAMPASREFIDAQIAELEALRERAIEADALDRELAEAGLDDAAVPGLAQLRSHERSLQRRLGWCLDQLGAARTRPARPVPQAKPAAPPRSTASVETLAPAVHPARSFVPIHAIADPDRPGGSGRIEDGKTNPNPAIAPRPSAADWPPLRPEEAYERFVARGIDDPADPVEHRRRRVDPARAVRQSRAARRRSRAGGS